MSLQGKHILWHVSAHGWGHAARQRELIRTLKEKQPEIQITLVSSAPEWFWYGAAVERIIHGNLSPIALEKNGVPDREMTAANLVKFLRTEKQLLSGEINLQRRVGADLVITDIDPLPVKAANINSIPAIGIGNFTWDWILGEMCPDLRDKTDRIAEMYSTGTYLRLPMGPDHSPFNTTVDMPLLRGGPEGNPERVENLIPSNKLKCLVAFRHLPEGFPSEVPNGMNVLTSQPEPQNPGWLNLAPEVLSKNNATFADLVAAADVVVTKPGYGMISQILEMGKPAVLIPMNSFPEERYLLREINTRNATSIVHPSRLKNAFFDATEATTAKSPGAAYPERLNNINLFVDKLLSFK